MRPLGWSGRSSYQNYLSMRPLLECSGCHCIRTLSKMRRCEAPRAGSIWLGGRAGVGSGRWHHQVVARRAGSESACARFQKNGRLVIFADVIDHCLRDLSLSECRVDSPAVALDFAGSHFLSHCETRLCPRKPAPRLGWAPPFTTNLDCTKKVRKARRREGDKCVLPQDFLGARVFPAACRPGASVGADQAVGVGVRGMKSPPGGGLR
ncbi:hypothetical protein D3C78_234970 [compost metagenome]